MSHLEKPPEALIDRAFNEGKHVGEPWCGTVYCPVCIEETFANLDVDLDSAAALALRELQKLDEALPTEALAGRRQFIIAAEDALGRELGLTCTGVAEGGGFYDHSGETCPIHEWLVPADQPEAQAARGRP